MRIAASIILIAGIGYLAFYLNSEKANHPIAKNEVQSDLKRSNEKSDNSKMDSLTNDKTENTALNSQLEKKKEFALNKEEKQSTINKEAQNIKPELNRRMDDKTEILSANSEQELFKKLMVKKEKLADKNSAIAKNILKGKVEDTLGNAIGFVNIRGKNQQLNTTTDADGRFKVEIKDSSIIATVAASGYKTKEVMLRDNNDQRVVLQTENRSLNEVSIRGSGMAKQKKKLSSEEELEGKAAGVIVSNSTQQSIPVQEKFDEYVRKNIHIPKNELWENYKGKVILSFEINKKGKPINIKVDQSLCADCDKEAIRLLEKTLKWKYVKDKRQVVSIQF
jgi:hypothetical protein